MGGIVASLSSIIAIGGKLLAKSVKSVKKKPKLPTVIPTSTMVGQYSPHEAGSYSCCRELPTILKRSNHMPTFTNATIIQTAKGLFLIFQRHNGMGAITLQKTINQNAICGKLIALSPSKVQLCISPNGR